MLILCIPIVRYFFGPEEKGLYKSRVNPSPTQFIYNNNNVADKVDTVAIIHSTNLTNHWWTTSQIEKNVLIFTSTTQSSLTHKNQLVIELIRDLINAATAGYVVCLINLIHCVCGWFRAIIKIGNMVIIHLEIQSHMGESKACMCTLEKQLRLHLARIHPLSFFLIFNLHLYLHTHFGYLIALQSAQRNMKWLCLDFHSLVLHSAGFHHYSYNNLIPDENI